MRQTLVESIKKLLPDVTELASVSLLANEHARQLAVNAKDTEFKTLAAYSPVPPGALQTRLLQSGVYPTDNLVNAYLADGSPELVTEKFQKQLQGVMGPVAFSNFGIGVVRKGGGWYVSLILLTQILSLDKIPLQFQNTGLQKVSGRILLPGYTQPKILMTMANGNVMDIQTRVSGQQFEADLPLNDKGLYSLEVNVQGALGPLPASNFILAVATPYPNTKAMDSNSEVLGDLTKARQTLLELVNRDRQSMGIGVLKSDSSLDQAAQSHCDDMVKNGFIGHNSPTQGTPQKQAAQFGVSDLVSQNLAVSRSLSNSQQELMSSPGHRKTILEPNHTHVGFGVTTGPDGFLYITQVFVQRKLALNPLPKTVKPGQTFMVSGTSSQTGNVGVFIQDQLQGDYQKVQAGEAFQLPVTLNQTGKVQLLIGFAEPGGNTLNFNFYNIWDLESKP